MRIDLAKIAPEGVRFNGEEEVDFEAPGDRFRVEGPVRYSFRAQYVSGELILAGELSVRVVFLCARCIEEFSRVVKDSAFFLVKEEADKNVSVDLTADIREAILCAFPSHPVCDAACRGLCPQCGVNLNKGGCNCRPAGDSRWSGLDGLKL